MNNKQDNKQDNIQDDNKDDNMCDIYQDIMNKYIEYYKTTYPEKKAKNMFDNIDYNNDNSTNHIMETFYMEILKYKKIDNNIYQSLDELDNIELTRNNDIYGLYINNIEIKCVSFSIISLIIEVINNDYEDWKIININ